MIVMMVVRMGVRVAHGSSASTASSSTTSSSSRNLIRLIPGGATTMYTQCELQFPRGHQHLFGPNLQGPRLYNSRPVYPTIGKHHHQQRQVEGYRRGEDQVTQVLSKCALIGRHFAIPRRPPPNDGRKTDGTGADPHGGYQTGGPLNRHPHGIAKGIRYGPVAIQRDYAQIQYGGGAEKHIQGSPNIAPVRAKEPGVLQNLI